MLPRKLKAFADGFLTSEGIGWLDARLVAIPEAEPKTGFAHGSTVVADSVRRSPQKEQSLVSRLTGTVA